jgi:hypothetical protein
MKTLILDYDKELHLGGTAKPGIQKTLDCRGDLRNLCGCPGSCHDREKILTQLLSLLFVTIL